MRHLRSTLSRCLLAACLAAASAGAVGQTTDGGLAMPSPLQQVGGAQEDSLEALQHSAVAFWRGMPRAEFDSRLTAGAQGRQVLHLGSYAFVAKEPTFDAQDQLTGVSLEFRSDDPKVIEEAFEAYKHALGAIEPDYAHGANGTTQVPDLRFAIMGWHYADGGESALARVHSFAAQKKAGNKTSAGVVTFAVRRF
ncbi:hypothetical protein D3C71_25610 [compost metagenome]